VETKTAAKALDNVWNDANRTENLKQKFVIKSAGGKPL